MTRQDWKKKMRESFEGYAEPAPKGLWEGVSAGLRSSGGAAGAGGALRAAKPRPARRAWPLAAAGAAAAALALLLLAPLRESRPEPFASPLLASASPVVQPAQMDAPQSLGAVRRTTSMELSQRGQDAPQPPVQPGGNVIQEENAFAEEPSSVVLPPATEPGRPEGPSMGSSEDGKLEFDDASLFVDEADESRNPQSVSLRLAYSGMGSSNSSASGYDAFYGSSVAAMRYSASVVADEGYSTVLMNNATRPVSTDRRHYRPISLGVHLGWDFAPRLSLVGGLEYSCLVSDLSSGTGNNRYETRQTLHYLGIPVSVEWSVVQTARLRVYLSAGGQMRKAMYGSSRTSYIVEPQNFNTFEDGPVQPQTVPVTERPLQWSAGLGAGLEYSLGSRLGLYLEPAAVYYFDNGSPVETYFKSNPFSFSLSLGLRLRLQ